MRALVFPVLGALAFASCSIPGTPATRVVTRMRLVPPAPVVETETIIELGLFDDLGKELAGARLRVEAHMKHPGMAPVISQAVDEGNGNYIVRLRFSMAGEWVLQLKGELADRRTIDRRLNEVSVRPVG